MRLAYVLAFSLALGSTALAVEKRFVVVVANNRSLTPGVAPLRYADDDGARWFEMLAPDAARISLFTVLDDDSQRIFHNEARLAEPPSRSAILARLAEYNRLMTEARAAGDEPVLYFVFVGHGEVSPDGEGFVSLLDAPLRRSELFHDVIAPSTAAFNHVIIDACNSYLMVARRGANDEHGPDATQAMRAYVADEDLSRYPTTGVLLSTSRAEASHEWAEYGSGVFSYEVRSALAGAADVNGDGRIEYSEVHAFVAAANLHVDDPRGRLDIVARAPAIDRARPLVDLTTSHLRHYLVLPQASDGHYWLEDSRGVRYGDFNKASERPMIIALVDSDYYYLRTAEREAQLVLRDPGALHVPPSSWHPRALAVRGSLADDLERHLFEVAYGPSFYRGFVASAGELAVRDGAAAFAPKDASALRAASLRARLSTIEKRDGYRATLIDWAHHRLDAGDLDETERTLRALESHTSH